MRYRHETQRAIARLLAPLWLPLVPFVLRWGFGYRVSELRRVRREFRRIRAGSKAPLLICANHLTLIDSVLIGWALAPIWRYLANIDWLPWNTPERNNFANTTRNRVLAYLTKCIPIHRGGAREDVAEVLERVTHLLGRGELALIFPEGGRSRTGRICSENVAWGVGRIVGALPGCRVLLVYLRGRGQESWGEYPKKGEVLDVLLRCIEPKSDARGARRSRDISEQIVAQLIRMERDYFHDRQ